MNFDHIEFRSIDHLTACNDSTKEIKHICDTEKSTCPLNASCEHIPEEPYHRCTCKNGFAFFPRDSEIASIENDDDDGIKIPDDDEATITAIDDTHIHPEVISNDSFELIHPLFSEAYNINHNFDRLVMKLEPSL